MLFILGISALIAPLVVNIQLIRRRHHQSYLRARGNWSSESFEVLLPAGAQKYGLVQDIELDPDGCVSVSPFDRTGLGAQIDFELIERKKLEVLG